MSSQTPLAEGRHNHPPRCCCLDPNDDTGQGGAGRCPGCSEHGALASVDGIVCPQCRTEIGRPHTDYCTLAPGKVWDGVLPAGEDCTCWHHIGRLDCPQHRHEIVNGNCKHCGSSQGEIDHQLVPIRCTGSVRKGSTRP